MAFHNVRFPLDVALGARGGPQRLTEIVTLSSGHEERNSKWADSRRRFNAGYGIKSRADLLSVVAFFEERRGRFHSFRWRDALDHSTNVADGVTPMDEVLGTGDGQTVLFQLIKTYGSAFDPYARTITMPVSGTVRVAVDGVEVDEGAFGVDELTGMVTLLSAPGVGQVVTAGFEFDVPVRFDTDHLDVELSQFDGAEVPNIPLIEVKK